MQTPTLILRKRGRLTEWQSQCMVHGVPYKVANVAELSAETSSGQKRWFNSRQSKRVPLLDHERSALTTDITSLVTAGRQCL